MFFIVWSTQNLSILGSSMTSFALVIWSYQQKGSALTTALLSVCSYAPYVLLSIFAGTLGDRWDKRRTMAVCDSLAGLTTAAAQVRRSKAITASIPRRVSTAVANTGDSRLTREPERLKRPDTRWTCSLGVRRVTDTSLTGFWMVLIRPLRALRT